MSPDHCIQATVVTSSGIVAFYFLIMGNVPISPASFINLLITYSMYNPKLPLVIFLLTPWPNDLRF